MTHEAPTTFEVLLLRQGRARALARSLVRDAAAADDLVQEALLAAWKRPAQATGDGRSLVSRMLGNLARDRARGEQRRARRERDVARGEATSDVAHAVVAAERQRALVDAVLALEEPYRGAVLLRWFEELPPRVVARRTGCSVEAVKKQLQRGLEQLRARLEQRFGKDGAWAVALLPLTGEGVLRGGGIALAASVLRRAVLVTALIGGGVVGVSALRPGAEERHDPARSLDDTTARAANEVSLEPATEARSKSPTTRSALASATLPDVDEHTPAGTRVAQSERNTPRFDPPFRARLVDLHGAPVAREVLAELELMPVGDDTNPTVRLRPDAEGWIESTFVPASGAAGLRVLEVVRGPWTVLTVGARSSAPSERYVVIAPAVRVAGVVQDSRGAPAAAVHAEVRADLRALGTFPFDLTTDTERRRVESSDENGLFELARVPTHARFVITFDAGARGSAAIPTPERDATGVVVRLALPAELARAALHGRVLDAAGKPVEGARVELAMLRAESDAHGEFRLEADAALLRAIASDMRAIAPDFGTLVAFAPDGRFARTTIDAEDLGPYVLRLPREMPRITGRLVDPAGVPLSGVRVVLYDGTRTSGRATLEASDGKSTAGRDVTDDDGRFALENLLERPYTLRFLRSDPFLVLDAPDVAAGTHDLVVRVPADLLLPRVTGRAVDSTGRALAGVRITVLAHESAPGALGSGLAGPSVRTDEGGRFELASVPRRAVWLDLDARPDDAFFSGRAVPLESLDLPHLGDVEVELDCDVVARLAEGFVGGQVRFVDAAGAAVRVKCIESLSWSFHELVAQKGDGTFGHLHVPVRATSAEVLDADGRVLRRVALTLTPLERHELEL
jgi:RNA polymerase sigma-70 factor (ECF subfamily)